MNKHAYLIMAHNKPKQLNFLISLLDDERNDIYLHIDIKATFDYKAIDKTKKSNIYFVERQRIGWGGASLIFLELLMLKKCAKRKYAYIHLLSGQDFPIKSQDYIHQFFNTHYGLQFIYIEDTLQSRVVAQNRIKYYWLFQEYMGSGTNRNNFIRKCLQYGLIYMQKIFGVNRIKSISSDAMKVGSQWFSITGDFAEYIISQETVVTKHFKYTVCADEVFIPLLLQTSQFKEHAKLDNNLRFLIWEGGSHPRVLNLDNENTIFKTEDLFARKFDCDRYPETKDMIKRIISKK